MTKIRIGKDIKIRWSVMIDNRPINNTDDISLIITNPHLQSEKLDHIVEDGVIVSYYRADKQKHIGTYKLTLWFNYGKENQSALDVNQVFKLVTSTEFEEPSNSESTEDYEEDEEGEPVLNITSVCNIEPVVDITGNCVIAGQSAYEIWLELGNTGTKEDFINSLKAGIDENIFNEIQNKLNILYKVDLTFTADKKVKKGSTQNGTLTWTVKVNGTNVNPVSQTINGVTLGNTVRTYSYSGITQDTTFTLVVDGVTKTSKVLFYNPVYYGAVADNYTISNDVTGLSQLTTYGTRANNITTTLNNQKFVYLYPSAFNALTSIKDGNNFEYLDDFTKVTGLTINGESYIGYIKNSSFTGSVTFKFS